MGRFTKRVVVGLTAALVMAGGAQAQFTLDDLEHGRNENYVNQYWYYFVSDDEDKLKEATIADYKSIITNAEPGDDFGPLSFVAKRRDSYSGAQAGTKAAQGDYVAAMEFIQFVSKTKGSSVYPVVGIGTSLTTSDDDGWGADFSKVDEIQFDMWAPEDMVVQFKVETIETSPTGPYGNDSPTCTPTADEQSKPIHKGCNPSNAYRYNITSDGEWKTYNIKIKPVTQYSGVATGETVPGGAAATGKTMGKAGVLEQGGYWGKAFNFNPANATKLAWQVSDELNPSLPSGGTLLLDNIKFIGSGVDKNFYVPKDQCNTCVVTTMPEPKQLISDFDDYIESPRRNQFGYYWYSYDDNVAGGDAMIVGQVEDPYGQRNPETGEFEPGMVMDVIDNGATGNGAFIEFEIANAQFQENGTGLTISSFVGIGTNFYDDLLATADRKYQSMGSHTGIAFKFKATGAVDFLTVEFNDNQNVEKIEADGTDGGQVWYTKIPVANSNWNTAVVPLTSLSLPLWIKASDWRYGKPFDKSKLAKIQFKYAGSGDGTLAIDDVYFYGGTTEASVKHVGNSKTKTAGIRATYNKGSVSVNWNAAAPVASGKISLVNTKGRVVASSSIAKTAGSKISANLGKGVLPSGMYFVRVDARDVNGKRIVQQAPITIVR